MKKLPIIGVSLLALLIAMVGCVETGITDETGPRINSINAQVMSGQEGMNVQVDVSVSNFEVVDTVGDNVTDGAQGDGYYVYYLDEIPASIQEEVSQLLAPGQTPMPEEQPVDWASNSFTWEGIQGGMHIFAVQLVDADGAPLMPPVVAAAALNVPAMTIVPEEMGDIVDIAVEDGRFTTLVTSLQAAMLVDTLKGVGPFTVFAPTDDAFNKLSAGTVDDLLNDIPQLTDILLYHVVPDKLMAADLVNLTSVETVSGASLSISVTNGEVIINDSQVIVPDIEVSNGVIHIIDTVLLPPEEEQPGEAAPEVPEAGQPGEATLITLAVDDTGYDVAQITVTAGTELTINLQNNGQNPHSFSVYSSQTEGTTAVYEGEAVQAGESITYTFTAPSEPGIYYFQDNEDPGMTGTYTLVVVDSS